MALDIIDDDAKPGGGYALVRLNGQGRSANDQLSIVVRRFREGDACLGPRGWQPGEHKFKPEAQRDDNGDLVLAIGPQIVNVVEEYDSIELRIPELNFSEALRWPPLTPSLDLPDMASDAPPTSDPQPSGGGDMSSLLDQRDKQREEALRESEKAAGDEVAPLEVVKEESQAPVTPPGPDDPEGGGRSLWIYLVVGLVILALAGLAAYYFRDDLNRILVIEEVLDGTEESETGDTSEDSEGDTSSDTDDVDSETDTDTDTDTESGTDTEAGTDGETEEATTLTPAERHQQALDALEAGDADTALPLLQQNIRDNYGPSLLSLAEFYTEREPAEALRLIADACSQGVEGSSDAYAGMIEDLRAKAETDSALKFALEVEGPAAAAQCSP